MSADVPHDSGHWPTTLPNATHTRSVARAPLSSFEESPVPLPSPDDYLILGRDLKVTQSKAVDEIRSAYKRRSRHMNELLNDHKLRRMEVHYQLGNCQHQINLLLGSIVRSKGKVPKLGLPDADRDATESVKASKRTKSRLKKNAASMQPDVDALTVQMQTVDVLMSELMDLDTKIDDASKASENAMRSLLTKLHLGDLSADDEDAWSEVSFQPTPTSGSVVSAVMSSPVLPELESYYDAVSKFGNMVERVYELKGERQEQLERRALQADQDRILERSDDEFNRTWQMRLDHADKDVEDARFSLNEARNACLEKGIEIPWSEEASTLELVDNAHRSTSLPMSSQIDSADGTNNHSSLQLLQDVENLSATIVDPTLREHYTDHAQEIGLTSDDHVSPPDQEPMLHAAASTSLLPEAGRISPWVDIASHDEGTLQATPVAKPIDREQLSRWLGNIQSDSIDTLILSPEGRRGSQQDASTQTSSSLPSRSSRNPILRARSLDSSDTGSAAERWRLPTDTSAVAQATDSIDGRDLDLPSPLADFRVARLRQPP